jgi:hypothetical protein
MSEYQSYTFSTVDRSLTRTELKKVSNLSSHIDVSSTGAYVEYNYGDFKHDPIEVLLRFFDVLVYDTNWGQQQIVFRFDADELDAAALDPFAVAEGIEINAREGSILVEAFFDENQGENGWFGSSYHEVDDAPVESTTHFVDLHRAISQGDYRSLLILLVKATCLEDDGAEEIDRRLIPRTPGCGSLTESLRTLTALVDLGPDWIEALAAFNPTKKPRIHRPTDWTPALSRLPSSERGSFLRRLLEIDPATVRGELKRRLRSLLPVDRLQSPLHQPESVPWSAIRDKAISIRRERENRARKEAEMRERAYVDAIIKHEHRLWNAAQSAIETKTTKGYDRAVALLKVLEDLAQHQGNAAIFQIRVNDLVERFPTLKGMQGRMKDAGLVAAPLGSPLPRYGSTKWKKLYQHARSEIMDWTSVD